MSVHYKKLCRSYETASAHRRQGFSRCADSIVYNHRRYCLATTDRVSCNVPTRFPVTNMVSCSVPTWFLMMHRRYCPATSDTVSHDRHGFSWRTDTVSVADKVSYDAPTWFSMTDMVSSNVPTRFPLANTVSHGVPIRYSIMFPPMR